MAGDRHLRIVFQSESLPLQQDINRLTRSTEEYRQGLVGLGAATGAIAGAIATGIKFE